MIGMDKNSINIKEFSLLGVAFAFTDSLRLFMTHI